MKKLLLMCCFLMGISAVSFAQNNRQNQNNQGQQGNRNANQTRMAWTPETQAKQLKDSLKLSDEQTAKVKVIYENQTKAMDSIRTASKGDMSVMREKMTPITTATNNKIIAVLTAEQAKAYKKQQEERMSRRRQR